MLVSRTAAHDSVASEEDEKQNKTDEGDKEKVSDKERSESSKNDRFVTPEIRRFQRLFEVRRVTDGEQPVMTQEEPDDQKRRH